MVYSAMNRCETSNRSWSHSVQVNCRIHGPKSKVISLSNYASDFKLSGDRMSVQCAPMSITYLENKTFKVDFSHKESGIEVHAILESTTDVVEVSPVTHLFLEDAEGGSVTSRFLPRSIATGTFSIDGDEFDCAGFASTTYVLQHLPQNAYLWNFCNLHASDCTIMLYQVGHVNNRCLILQYVSKRKGVWYAMVS